MSGPYVVGIDLGTQSSKASIFDTEGKLVAEATQSVNLFTPRANWVEQDPKEIYLSALSTVRHAAAKAGVRAGEVKGIAIDGQIFSMVRIDENWNPLGALESYLDTRSQRQKDALLAEHGELIMDSNGIYPYIGPKLLWWKEHDLAEYKRTYKALQVNSFVAGRMAGLKGRDAFVDVTCMGGYGWSDIRNFCWQPEIAEMMGVDPDKAPRPARCEEIIGGLSPEAAEACGLEAGIPIAAGLGDAIAGWVGVGAVEPGILVDTCGTTNHLGLCVDRYQPDLTHSVLTHYPSPIPGLWYPVGYSAGSGRSHSWFVEEFCMAKDGRENLKEVYDELEAAAAKLPAGSEGMIMIPHLGGRVCPYEPDVRGLFLGFTWKHTQAHFYRAILEGIAYEYYCYLRVARALYPELPLQRVVIIGGGAKSALWTQIKANILGIPHAACTQRTDSAPWGAAIVAGSAVGLYPDGIVATAKLHSSVAEDVDPVPADHQAYQGYADFYYNLFAQMAPVFADLASVSAA